MTAPRRIAMEAFLLAMGNLFIGNKENSEKKWDENS